MTEPCPGPCNAAWRRADPATRGDPIPGQPAWCPPCAARIRACLAELSDLAALLDATADGHREQPATPVRGSRHRSSPSPEADTYDELTRILSQWEQAYRDHRGWPSPPRRGRLATISTTTIAWLGQHLDGILESPFALDFGLEILQWHRQLAKRTKAGIGSRKKPVPCPRCGLRLLVHVDGTDYVICAGCNRHMTIDEYKAECETATEDLERAG